MGAGAVTGRGAGAESFPDRAARERGFLFETTVKPSLSSEEAGTSEEGIGRLAGDDIEAGAEVEGEALAGGDSAIELAGGSAVGEDTESKAEAEIEAAAASGISAVRATLLLTEATREEQLLDAELLRSRFIAHVGPERTGGDPGLRARDPPVGRGMREELILQSTSKPSPTGQYGSTQATRKTKRTNQKRRPKQTTQDNDPNWQPDCHPRQQTADYTSCTSRRAV